MLIEFKVLLHQYLGSQGYIYGLVKRIKRGVGVGTWGGLFH